MSNPVLFALQSADLLSIKGAPKFLARISVSNLTRLSAGSCRRTVMLNATGGVLGALYAARTADGECRMVLLGDHADAREAWVRQVAAAFDDEVEKSGDTAFFYTGELPITGLQVPPHGALLSSGLLFLDLGWARLVVGPGDAVRALHANLIKAGIAQGDEASLDALRILAREPAEGSEYEEGANPYEAGFADAIDFDDATRVFIGRALTEALHTSGDYKKLNLVAFERPFDPNVLTAIPRIKVGNSFYELTSITHVPDMQLTAGLVALPAAVEEGASLPCEVKAAPAVACRQVRVLGPQA